MRGVQLYEVTSYVVSSYLRCPVVGGVWTVM